MSERNKDNFYPHTLKVDDNYASLKVKNYHINNLQTLNEVEDYICIFENNGKEFPEVALGIKYKLAKTKDERKELCESASRRQPGESRLFVRRDDWIDPDESEFECATFDSSGKRLKYDESINQEFLTLPSKKLCDSYNDKDGEKGLAHPKYSKIAYTKMIPKKITNPVIDLKVDILDDTLLNRSKAIIFWLTYGFVAILVILWTVMGIKSKQSSFYDNLSELLMNKFIYYLILFGVYMYLFCPFNVCMLDRDLPLYRRDFTKATKDMACDYTKNTSSYLENRVFMNYDNSYYMKFFDPVISYLFNGNRMIKNNMNKLNKSVCEYCSMDYTCIENSPYNQIDIVKPKIIEVNFLDLVNSKDKFVSDRAKANFLEPVIDYLYKYDSNNKPYDTGTIIIVKNNFSFLKSSKPELFQKLFYNSERDEYTDDDINNSVYMCCVVLTEESSSKNDFKTMDGSDYKYKWLRVKHREGDFFFNEDLNTLRIKRCPISYRVFSVGTNYDLLGYNISLKAKDFVKKFKDDNIDFYEYPYYPEFNIKELNGDFSFGQLSNFVKRKLTKIYKYLIKDPSYKFRTKNVSFINGRLLRYDHEMTPRQLFSKPIGDVFTEFNLYLAECKKYRKIIIDLSDYYNDDEDDIDYLKYYNPKYEDKNNNLYLLADYKYDFDNILKYIKLDDLDDYKEIMFRLYEKMVNLDYLQREDLRDRIIKLLMKKFEELRDKNLKRKNVKNFTGLEYLQNYGNKIIKTSKPISFKYRNKTISFNEEYKLQEYVIEHIFDKNYKKDSVENTCKICGQKCILN